MPTQAGCHAGDTCYESSLNKVFQRQQRNRWPPEGTGLDRAKKGATCLGWLRLERPVKDNSRDPRLSLTHDPLRQTIPEARAYAASAGKESGGANNLEWWASIGLADGDDGVIPRSHA